MKRRSLNISEIKLTESNIQNLLYSYCKRHNRKLMVPNILLFNWESDFISVSKLGLITEYEIKLTKQDLKNDFKKKKHWCFKNYENYYVRLNIKKKDVISSYFYYVVPEILNIDGFKLPSYAGLIKISGQGIINIVSKAPRLNNERISVHKLKYIANGLMLRYWRDRVRD